ncbi:MAG: cobalt-precorrin 5A hydrolase [bacterium]|nr:cobalt-precorrin 5A hydrolase [bacterium]
MKRKLAILAFTDRGVASGEQITQRFSDNGWELTRLAPVSHFRDGWRGFEKLDLVMEELFLHQDALLFIGATGIAVRSIASFVASKLSDPAVLVMDEDMEHVIPLLSGHVGGANELARQLAVVCGAEPVITTATDRKDVFSVDTFAKNNQLTIVEKDEIKHLSASLLKGEPIGALTPKCGFVVSKEIKGHPFSHTLHLVPQDFVVGIGCKKDKPVEQLKEFLQDIFSENGWSIYRIRAFASIDRKAHEKGLVTLAKQIGVPFLTFPADVLANQKGDFSHSDFVEQTIGVGNVCERSALAAAVSEGWMEADAIFDNYSMLRKHSRDGMTISVLSLSGIK